MTQENDFKPSALERLLGSVTRPVEVNGVSVCLLPMTAEEMVVAQGISGDDVAANMDKVVDILFGCLREPCGCVTPGVSDEDRRHAIRRLGPAVLAELFEECCHATGITEESQDKIAKN